MKKLMFVALSVVSLMMVPTSAFATQTVVVNGGTYTCSNSCAVNSGGGDIIITDCCGGTVNGEPFVRLTVLRQ